MAAFRYQGLLRISSFCRSSYRRFHRRLFAEETRRIVVVISGSRVILRVTLEAVVDWSDPWFRFVSTVQ